MRAKHNKPTTKYRGLLRRAVAVCTALAMVCGMAAPAFAVPVDVLNEETGLIETVDDTELYGEDYGYGYYDDAIADPPR